jgi:hypothetical protein
MTGITETTAVYAIATTEIIVTMTEETGETMTEITIVGKVIGATTVTTVITATTATIVTMKGGTAIEAMSKTPTDNPEEREARIGDAISPHVSAKSVDKLLLQMM